jgi:proteasome assembly chaperone (PAC2) family protein
MNSLREVAKVGKELFEISRIPRLQNPSLIVSWQTRDIGKIGSRVIDFLNQKLGGQEFAEIKPLGFLPLRGAIFKDDLVQVPESKFWACEKNDLLIFKSDEPKYAGYKFLNTVLDLAEYHCKAKELYTVSGTASFIAHTNPRRILAVFNQLEFQKRLRGYGLLDMDYEGEPAINSYLLWVAKRKGIPGLSLWPEVPFYLTAREDPQATKLTLSFLNKRFDLGMDLGEFDLESGRQNEKITWLREENSEIDKCIGMLEKGFPLSEEEQMKLAKGVYKLLEKRR